MIDTLSLEECSRNVQFPQSVQLVFLDKWFPTYDWQNLTKEQEHLCIVIVFAGYLIEHVAGNKLVL